MRPGASERCSSVTAAEVCMKVEALLLQELQNDPNDEQERLREKYHRHLQKRLREIRSEETRKEGKAN